MKISLAWIADHLRVAKNELNNERIVELLTTTTAEIDAVERIVTDSSSLFAVTVTEIHDSHIVADCAELKKKLRLSARKDGSIDSVYLAKIDKGEERWATLADVGSKKEGLMPSLWLPAASLKGSWRDGFEREDTIITIDNKAVTNRPDLWGHRGFAREVAALLGHELVSEEFIYATKPIKNYDVSVPAHGSTPFLIEIAQKDQPCGHPCKRLAALYMPTVEYRPSLLSMAVRLARVDSRPLDLLVDMTNYVMFDIGHPMHAFDAEKIGTNHVIGRCALEGEKIKLLDGDEVTLTSADYVIANGQVPISLAGIMGGQSTAVSKETHSLLLEAAHFDPATIRRTANRLKKRTESSARFEKNLDPNQNTAALLRYLKLMEDSGVAFTQAESIISLGALAQEKTIVLSHELIEQKIGIEIPSAQVERILAGLGFGVTKRLEGSLPIYTVIVPTFRSTKDVTIPEDIIEEVARFVGYSSITPVYPTRSMKAFDTTKIERMRALKAFFAEGLSMHEVQTYAFFDEEFLRVLKYDPQDALRVANPLSEHWQRLVTSLVPNLIKCISTNQSHETQRFFECNRVWFFQDHPTESQEFSGIWYEMKKTVDFYEGKALLATLFHFLKLEIRWEKPAKQTDPWYDSNQTAQLWYGDRIIGQAGKVDPLFLRSVAEGDAFIFELDAHFLFNCACGPSLFKPLPKYPSTDLDLSVIVPLEVTVARLEKIIRAADERIVSVVLIDSFTRPDWQAKKSLTFRFTVYDPEGTLTKEEIDTVWQHVAENVKAVGAEIR